MSFSVHESMHGWTAYKLGDPTARNLGRITLNPLKHLDPIGTVCMIFAHVGWARPVPVNSRNFKKPKRDMAIVGAAGPLANLALALIHLLLLKIAIAIILPSMKTELVDYSYALYYGSAFSGSFAFSVLAMLVYILYLGIVLNVSLAIFNLIPIPPFDGSRIFYVFLPTKWYFWVMKYERIIMLVVLILVWVGALTGPLSLIMGAVINLLLKLVGLYGGTDQATATQLLLYYVEHLVA